MGKSKNFAIGQYMTAQNILDLAETCVPPVVNG